MYPESPHKVSITIAQCRNQYDAHRLLFARCRPNTFFVLRGNAGALRSMPQFTDMTINYARNSDAVRKVSKDAFLPRGVAMQEVGQPPIVLYEFHAEFENGSMLP
jgi:hypothetical protein